jgi:hypothetical protein
VLYHPVNHIVGLDTDRFLCLLWQWSRAVKGALTFILFPNYGTMSQTSPSIVSPSNYQGIFDNALQAYKRKTGKDLTSDPLLHSLETCHSPDAVLDLLRAQIVEPGQPQSSGNKFTAWLDPTVNVLSAFSATIGGFVGLVSFKEFEMTRPKFAV